jgi:hypothetical protein
MAIRITHNYRPGRHLLPAVIFLSTGGSTVCSNGVGRCVHPILVAALSLLPTVLARGDDVEFFEKKIRPLLVERCFECHSAKSEELKGGLRLDTRDGTHKGGEAGPALVAGDVEKSLLIRAVRYKDEKLQMPPDEKLSDAQIADLEAWVKMGAPDPREPTPVAVAATTPTTVPAEWIAKLETGKTWWAFQKPVDHAPPAVTDGAWPRNDIDRFILGKLEAKHLKPAPQADRRTLIRRAYFDLIGLPPPADEVETFVRDESPDAYAKLVDKLLASPLYGQRWARHWLDVVRYTDSFDSRIVGNTFDCAFAWRYRDWVVDSFNDDLPYDRFVREQVAGDLLPSRDGSAFNRDGVVATGVYMIGEWGGGDADKEKLVSDIVDDQVDLTGRAFMGLTVACARCHDHKFDPIATKDYYGLAGIFYSSHILSDVGPKGGSPVNVRAPLMSEGELAARKADEAKLAELDQEIESKLDEHYTQLASAMIQQADKYFAAAHDFENWAGGGERPSVEKFAEERGLRPYELAQWKKLVGQPALDVMTTPQPVKSAGLYGWRNKANADAPVVIVNKSNDPISELATLTFAANSVNLHPSQTGGVAVSWKSPIAGKVRVTGKVIDGHDSCGDGVAWSLSAGGEIASGTIANGGKQDLKDGTGGGSLASVDVTVGAHIQLAVLPKVEYSCDTTRVELEITQLDGEKRVWNLTHAAVAAAKPANPLPDEYGNADTWVFHDLTTASAGAEIARSLSGMDDATRTAALAKADGPLRQFLTAPRGSFWADARKDDANLDTPTRATITNMRGEAKKLRDEVSQPIPEAQAMQEGGTPKSLWPGVQDVPVHIRGRYDRLGDVVPRRFPQVIAGVNQPPITKGSGRRELAEWLTNPDHPLTARVMVNRIWQHHFGDGLVRTANNFGKLGTPPTHPELLDHLAVAFVKSGWSVKAMHRAMMLSATYMQASEASAETFKADPANELLGRMNRRKLEAEALRDSMLSVAGTLDTSPGGVSINDLNTPRRSLYVMTIRSIRSDYRALFDAADSSAIVEQRNDSIVAPQALFLMNHPFVIERAKQLADRATKNCDDDPKRIDWLYRTLFGRPPTEKEAGIGREFVASSTDAWPAYCQVLLCSNEFMYVD